jgi:hypothetical protein
MADTNIGKAESIRAPQDIIEKIRSKFQRYTPDVIQDALKNTMGIGNVLGLNDPASAAGGGSNASIAMLAASKEAGQVPGLRQALEYAVQRWPRLSSIGKESQFVEELPGYRGVYDPVSGLTQVALKEKGQPRSVSDILRTVGHELIGHGRQFARGMRDYPMKQTYGRAELKQMPERRRVFLENANKEYRVPYEERASEIDANTRGGQFVESLNKAKMVPLTPTEAYLMERRSGLNRSISDAMKGFPTEIKTRPRSGAGSGPLGLTEAEYNAIRSKR